MAKKRKEEGFNLAFLDVMACGLGAVLMILIVVKFNANTPDPSEELQRLKQQSDGLEAQKARLRETLEVLTQSNVRTQSSLQVSQAQIDMLEKTKSVVQSQIDQEKAVIAQLEDAIRAAGPLVADDSLSLDGIGEEQYLLGLKIEGEKIGILLDASASMTDEQLLDIFKRKVQSSTAKQQGPKWRRTQRILSWMLSRIPENSEVLVVVFNATARTLGGSTPIKGGDEQALRSIMNDFSEIVPTDATNLQVGLQAISKSYPDMTNLYLITDGLPTQLTKGSGFPAQRGCDPSDLQAKTISGECRFAVLQHSFARFAPRVKTDVVLLPLEGDPHAASAYWNWANATGGILISPAETWP